MVISAAVAFFVPSLKLLCKDKHPFAGGLRIEQPIRFLCLVKGETMCEQPIHLQVAVGNKAGACRLSNGIEGPGGHDGQLLADHIWADTQGHGMAFTDKANTALDTCAAHSSGRRVGITAAIERQVGAFTVCQVFKRAHRETPRRA